MQIEIKAPDMPVIEEIVQRTFIETCLPAEEEGAMDLLRFGVATAIEHPGLFPDLAHRIAMTMRAIGAEFYAKGEMAKFDQLAATLRAMEAALRERAEEDATRKAAEQKRNGTQVPVPTDELADLMADDGA